MEQDPALASARWFKATASTTGQGCVEAAFLPGGRVAVRDSKDPGGGVHVFTGRDWRRFLRGVRCGEFGSPRA